MNTAEKRLLGVFLALFVLGVAAGNLPKLTAAPLTLIEEKVNLVPDKQEVVKNKAKDLPKTKKKAKSKAKNVPTKENPLAINKADSLQIITLPGIGPAMTHRILEYKRKHGSFKKPADLLKIKGIGKKKQEMLLPLVIFD